MADAERPYLSVVIPVYNEARHIRELLKRVRAVPIDKEIICVDDCSTDGTWDLLQEEMQQPGTRVFHHPQNGGKGAAVRTGLEQAQGQVILVQDADLEYDPQDYPTLLEPLQRGETQVVYGSRFLGEHNDMSLAHNLGNRGLTLAANVLYGAKLTDLETCYKVFTAEVCSKLRLVSPRWGFDPEITAKIRRMGYTIKEVPISYHGRSYEEGKGIHWQDGITVFLTLVRFRFLP